MCSIPHKFSSSKPSSNSRKSRVKIFKYFFQIKNNHSENLDFLTLFIRHDVYLSNTRGTIYSLDHEELTPQDEIFWRYSWGEMKYDHLANLKFIFKNTNQKIYYIGHSLGSVSMFATLADPQDRNISEEISSMVEEFYFLSLIIYCVKKYFFKNFTVEKYSRFSFERRHKSD